MNRRDCLRMSSASGLLAGLPQDLSARLRETSAAAAAKSGAGWDRGRVLHLLPTVSDREMLIKASFDRALTAAPSLRVGARAVSARMSDTRGECWQFHARGLEPGRR